MSTPSYQTLPLSLPKDAIDWWMRFWNSSAIEQDEGSAAQVGKEILEGWAPHQTPNGRIQLEFFGGGNPVKKMQTAPYRSLLTSVLVVKISGSGFGSTTIGGAWNLDFERFHSSSLLGKRVVQII